MARILVILFFVPVLLMIPPSAVGHEVTAELSEVLDSLDMYLARRADYRADAAGRIDVLRRELTDAISADSAVRVCRRMGDTYRTFNVDSATAYYRMAADIAATAGLQDERWDARLRLDGALPMSGVFKEAIDDYESIPYDSVPATKRLLYHQVGSEIYLLAYSFYPEGDLRNKYRSRAVESMDSLLGIFAPGSLPYTFVSARKHLLDGSNAVALGELSEVLPELDSRSALAAKACNLVAEYYAGRPGKEDLQLYYLTKSAIADIINGNAENESLQQLGQILYERGDVNRAFRCLSAAVRGYAESGARVRAATSADFVTDVYDGFIGLERRNIHMLYTGIAVLILLLAGFVVVLILMVRDRRRMDAMQRALKTQNSTQNTYIKNILKICYLYIERLSDFNRYVGRKIKAGQVKDLYEQIESGRFIQEQDEHFYEAFDEAFNNICPNFVEELNNLLIPERRFAVPTDHRLTPELRLVAFMRLGITDSAELAKFLGLSLNTIYTYRNRLKSRALNRDGIEAQIRNIGEV